MKLSSLEDVFPSYERWTVAWDAKRAEHGRGDESLLALVEKLHRFNYDLWNQEDIARRSDVPDAVIRQVKRAIDRLNQQRNDTIEELDGWLLATFYPAPPDPRAAARTETPGSVFDRLSILSLKILRMREQTERGDAPPDHIAACARRLGVLQQQRDDLRDALRLLVSELNAGVVRMRVYRQFKMYNDPTLNPQLYAGHSAPAGAAQPMNQGSAI